MHKLTLLAAATVVAGAAIAQQPLGTLTNAVVTYTTRAGANTVQATIFNRLDKEAYAGWGVDAANPGMRKINGLHFLIQDQDLATQDPYSIAVYGESTATPNFPDAATALGTAGTFVLPAGTGTGAYNVTSSFATPVLAPATGDVFVGVDSGPWNATTTDGLSIWGTSADPARTASIDLPGFGMPTAPADATTFGGRIVAGVASYATFRALWIEPITTSAAGTATALHYGDALHTNANNAPGTTCQFSAQFPDAVSPSRNAGRADDVGLNFVMTGLADNTPVIFLVDVGSFGLEIPLATFIPGSTGVSCLNLATFQTVGLGLTLTGATSRVLTVPAAARTAIAGLPLLQQAVAFDAVLGVGHAGPCSRQVF